MPILRMDQFGRIYESSPDREDGLGYKGHATPVTQGDVTLGSAYIKSNRELREQALREARLKKMEEAEAARQRKIAREKAMQARVKAMKEDRLLQNEAYQENLKKKALQMGCACTEMKDSLVGNKLTANGQTGYAGMSRDQQAIHRHLSGMGVGKAYQIPNQEIIARQTHEKNLRDAIVKKQASEKLARLVGKIK